MSKNILVVDDSRLNVRLMTDILEKEGYTVYSCSDGSCVLEISHNNDLDVILLDVIMPGIDGFEVCKLLKADLNSKDIPIIMITSKTDSGDVKKALELGAFDYIKKPIDEVEVIARIQSAIRFKEYQEKLKDMAMKDGLTGLYNHSLLVELFNKEIEKQQKNDNPISFVMIDIDFFKNVNDTYGHIFGDKVLQELSRILLKSVGFGDIVGRYGGEEFSIVFPSMGLETLKQVCERIRKNVEENELIIENKIIKITISMGAYCKVKGDNIKSSEMIKKADEALYRSKKSGRNKVEIS